MSDKMQLLDVKLLKLKDAGDQVIVAPLHMLRGELLFLPLRGRLRRQMKTPRSTAAP